MSIDTYIGQFQKLKVNKSSGHESPHKACMLLAVLSMAEAGSLDNNAIRFLPSLLDRYNELFAIVKNESDHPNPYFPFFHLRSESFWHLKAVSGREAVVEAIDSARSYSIVQDNIEYAYLDEELFEYISKYESREELRQLLITRWFGQYSDQLNELLTTDKYERNLRKKVYDEIEDQPEVSYDTHARDTAFRRVVTEAYDYRCAATGLRMILPGALVMVQAAHLIPFSESRDDDPRNGIALTPDFHWVMDRGIISPGADMKWHVSKLIDDRIADNKAIADLEGKELILPKDKRFWPRSDALESRHSTLK